MSKNQVRFVYFAWLRERLGKSEEFHDLPDDLSTVGEMLDWLSAKGEIYNHALQEPAAIRVALDMHVADRDAPLGSPKEIALFPPMTGG